MGTYFNLPEKGIICIRCVMSKQRPAAVQKFCHTHNRDGAKYMNSATSSVRPTSRRRNMRNGSSVIASIAKA
jgi:hypothetical protein